MKCNKRIKNKRRKMRTIALFFPEFSTRRRVRYVVVAGQLRRVIVLCTEVRAELSQKSLAALEFLEADLL